MPEIDDFTCGEEVHACAAWRSLPIVVLTAKDIATKDRQRRHGLVETVLRTSEYSREELLNKVRGLGTAYVRHKAARDAARARETARVSSP